MSFDLSFLPLGINGCEKCNGKKYYCDECTQKIFLQAGQDLLDSITPGTLKQTRRRYLDKMEELSKPSYQIKKFPPDGGAGE